MGQPYVPRRYWEELLPVAFDESSVAYPWLAVSFNRAMYAGLRRSVSRALEGLRPAVELDHVLDVGSGTGIWIDHWRERGAQRITGLDLTQAAVDRLRGRYRDHRIIHGDIADPALELPADCTLASAMSVLLHITDDERFHRAFANLARSLRPGGVLLLVEPALAHGWRGRPFDAAANSRARPLAEYEAALDDAGLDLLAVRPATCLLANPVDARSAAGWRAEEAAWDAVQRLVGRRERVGAVLGRALLGLDGVLCRRLPHGPSAKVLLARRRA